MKRSAGDGLELENIRITENIFREGAGISAHHTASVEIGGNTPPDREIPVRLAPNCRERMSRFRPAISPHNANR